AAMGQNRSSTTERTLPGPTAGGAVSAGMGGALAGAELTKTIGAMTAKEAVAGGVVVPTVAAETTAAVEGASVAAATQAATATGADVAATTAAGSSMGPWGAGIGALVGIGAYLFS
ncbi:MAG: hypothetical protein Q7U56_13860, partial [Humidesulfovibrio sp.]|nr:hypothetical protein [Humidesulfovibrio sp.]